MVTVINIKRVIIHNGGWLGAVECQSVRGGIAPNPCYKLAAVYHTRTLTEAVTKRI